MDNTERNGPSADPPADSANSGDNSTARINTDESSHEINTHTDNTSGAATSSTTTTNTSGDRSHRTELGIFERFMDNFLGRARTPGSSSHASTDNDSQNENNATTGANDTVPNITPLVSADASDATESADARAIIITVNYVFSDENNPQNPNRAGSLIMSLPNNSSNRDPLVIQEFIRLATHMAYTSIVNGLNKEKGITLSKFNSFPYAGDEELALGECGNCSICFEDFDKKRKNDEDERPAKRRKVEKREQPTHDASTNESIASTHEGNFTTEQEIPSGTGLNSAQNVTNESIDSSAPGERKLLVDYTGNFDHHAIKMPCGHIFGKDCLFYWLKQHTTCPLCRASVAEPDVTDTNPNSTISMFDIPSNITNLNDTNTNTNGNSNASTMPIGEQAQDISNEASRTTTAFGSIPTRFHYFGLGGSNSSHTPLRRILRSGVGVPERLQAESSNTSETNPFSHVYNYLRRQRPNPSESLFPTGMSSRRTANGVETTSTDNSSNHSEILDFLNLRSLVDDNPDITNRPDSETEQEDTNDTNDNRN